MEAMRNIIREPPKFEKFEPQFPRTKSRTKELEEIEESHYKPITREITPEVRTEPIFVRIDKYQQAMSQFQDIKKRIAEIDNLLRNIKRIFSKAFIQMKKYNSSLLLVRRVGVMYSPLPKKFS